MPTAKLDTVAVASKPHLQTNLRATWRKSAQHGEEQLKRFFRLFLLSAIPAVADLVFAKHFDYRTLLAALVPVGETTFRQIYPALGAQGVDEAPGATIVPAEVQTVPAGLSTADPVT